MASNKNEVSSRVESKKDFTPFIADVVAVIGLIAVCLAVALPRWRSGIDWGDEGFLAYGAIRVSEGQVPNRDFVSLQPPLSFYTAAIVFKIFGTSLSSLRILGLAIYVAIPLLLYGIARFAAKRAIALAAAIPAAVLGLPYFYFVPFAVWQGIAASIAAAFLYLQATLGGRRWLAWPAGALTAASILLRHDQGLYLFISILAFSFALKRIRAEPNIVARLGQVISRWLTGISIVVLPGVIYWWFQGALPDMFKQLILFPLTLYGETSSLPFHYFNGRLPLSRNAITALYYLPPLIEIAGAAWLIRRSLREGFSTREAMLAFLIVWSGLFYFQVLTRSDIFHLLMTLPPFFVLMASLWSIFFENSANRSSENRTVASIGAIALIAFLWAVSPVALPDVKKATTTLGLPRGGVRVENAEAIAQLVRTVQAYAPADRSILCLPYQPIFYFLCERRNPTRWNYLWPGDQTAEEHESLIKESKNDPPAAVLIINEQKMASYASPILDYVHAEFRPAGNSGELMLYLPRGRASASEH